MTRPTVRTPPPDPNDRPQTAYSSLSDADLWGKISVQLGHWVFYPSNIEDGTLFQHRRDGRIAQGSDEQGEN